MNSFEVNLLIALEQRRLLRQKIIAWECANGIQLTPMKRDFTKGRIEQLVDEAFLSDKRLREKKS